MCLYKIHSVRPDCQSRSHKTFARFSTSACKINSFSITCIHWGSFKRWAMFLVFLSLCLRFTLWDDVWSSFWWLKNKHRLSESLITGQAIATKLITGCAISPAPPSYLPRFFSRVQNPELKSGKDVIIASYIIQKAMVVLIPSRVTFICKVKPLYARGIPVHILLAWHPSISVLSHVMSL